MERPATTADRDGRLRAGGGADDPARHKLERRLLLVGVACALGGAAREPAHALDLVRMAHAASGMGPRAERAARDVRELLVRLATLDDMTRLERVNSYVNRRVTFTPDTQAWNQNDYWASPLETLGRGEGDCEDYAITKYFILVHAGVAAAKLRLVYVRALIPVSQGGHGGPQAHMVLAYYPDNDREPLILDNLTTDIRAASLRPDLTPVFSFNGVGLWSGAGAQSAGDPQARLSRWRDVMAKARLEGFE